MNGNLTAKLLKATLKYIEDMLLITEKNTRRNMSHSTLICKGKYCIYERL